MTATTTARRHGPRALLAAGLTGLLAFGLGACATPEPGGSGATGSVLRLPISDVGSEIDPLTVADGDAQFIVGLVTEQLVSFDEEGAAVPRLATEWAASDDGLTWTFTLRDGAVFNNGDEVTADDVVATFEAITGEDSVSPAKSAFAGVLESVAADGEGTVEFTLVRPFSDFPRLLAGSNTGILPADYEPGTWLENPVGAGQFLLEDYTVGTGARYVKNPDYWNADAIHLDGVELKVYADPQASLVAFQADDIDRIQLTPDVAATIDLDEYNEVSSGYSHFFGVHLDVTTAPFDDPTIRQALAWAIDRQDIVDRVFEGEGEPGNDVPFLPDYQPRPASLEQREQDLERVAGLLDGRIVSFTITTDNQLYGEVLQQQLNAVDGFSVELEVLSGEQYYAEGDDSPWLNAPVTITSWGKRVPSQYYALFYAEGAAWNASKYANPELAQLVAEYDATVEGADRQRLADEIATIQWTDVPTIIPVLAKSTVVENPRLQGEPAGVLDFWTGYDLAGVTIASE